MEVEKFVERLGVDFYTGVPDSLLSPLCNFLMKRYGISKSHMIGANEGNCVGMAAGYYLATGKIPAVYMQNSGIGNSINPIASLLNEKVYGIPCVFIIGWRGMPGEKDEPQHVFQGEITEQLMETLCIPSYIVGAETSLEEYELQVKDAKGYLKEGKSVAFIIKKGALNYSEKVIYENPYSIRREAAIEEIAKISENDVIVSTTGKISRELFESREKYCQLHNRDFLTVGSMGHCSSIALRIAIEKPERKVWCIDGDGAVLMHMGALSVTGNYHPDNLIHIVLNNEAHESVGGLPTTANKTDLAKVASACGYSYTNKIEKREDIRKILLYVKELKDLSFVEIKVALGSRRDLGRPTGTARENKKEFMKYIGEMIDESVDS